MARSAPRCPQAWWRKDQRLGAVLVLVGGLSALIAGLAAHLNFVALLAALFVVGGVQTWRTGWYPAWMTFIASLKTGRTYRRPNRR